MYKILFGLLLVCGGCGSATSSNMPNRIIELRINDNPKSPNGHSITENYEYILAGAAIWNEVGGELVITNSAEKVIECSTDPIDEGDILAVTTTGGITADCDWLDSIENNDYRVHLFAHELGHVWGMVHTMQYHDIMYGGINSSTVLQGDDLAQWFELYP